jgi:hypothetical protein
VPLSWGASSLARLNRECQATLNQETIFFHHKPDKAREGPQT